jgi:outer membrane protein OmpA-like peptidoglycan-associated protein
MKTSKIVLAAACTALSFNAGAQVKGWLADSVLSRFCIDINARGGLLAHDMTTANTLGNYLNAVNSNTGSLKFNNAWSAGGELQLAYFFGNQRHWGVGLGLSYYKQAADVSLENFHVEYQATDFKNNVYRQVITANNLTEKVDMTSLNIPLVLKYKNRFSKRWGFTADLGAVYNVQMENSWNADASFNYEAVYKFADLTHTTTVYDNGVTPVNDGFFMTAANYIKNNPGGNVQTYFDNQRALGYNVGLNVKPTTNSGKVSYTSGSIGFVLKPSFNLFLSDRIALDLGAYYMYQPYKNDVPKGYTLTGNTGDYTSVLKSVSKANAQSYGVNVGVRLFFGKAKDRDHDGVIDRKDLCPDDSGSVLFQGCPDTDGDGIVDKNDSCPKVKGIAKFYGCPDSDGDGIQDKEDECPFVKGLVQFKGCPDRDGDGIPDKDDDCPDKKGLAQFRGCPDTDGDGLPDNVDDCPLVAGPVSNRGCPEEKKDTVKAEIDADVNAPIMFDLNKTTIKAESLPTLQKAAQLLNSGQETTITIDGFTDATGPEDYNYGLSLLRAKAVKTMLVAMGADAKKIHIKGYGEKHPAATNKTREGRAKNRRATMKLK